MVSIPSQVGTLFGRCYQDLLAAQLYRLNTLSGGHPLRTRKPVVPEEPPEPVSIPSQVGTLFGLCPSFGHTSLNKVSIPSQVGTLFGLAQGSLPPEGD